MKVLSVIDSFKGTISSIELSSIVTEEFENKGHMVKSFAISDGGEGLIETFLCNGDYTKKTMLVNDPLGRKINSFYIHNNEVAIIELAKASGICLLQETELNPYITSTFGFGEMILDALKNGFKNIILGIGGSATNDGGAGFLEALKVKFYDKDNQIINHMCNEKLKLINSIDTTTLDKIIKDVKFTVLSDVTNPLLGSNGATYIYSKQKGAKISDYPVLESNMSHFSSFNNSTVTNKGTGAAGGVGYGLVTYLHARLVSGIDYILDMIDFDKYINETDIVITGEGKLDNQSIQGKVIDKVIQRSKDKKVILVCAINELNQELSENVKIYSICNSICTKEESLKNPQYYFRQLIRKLV